MRRAIALAGSHRTHPNPRVGAVVLDVNGSVAGEGFHLGPGHPHAEVVALTAAGPAARGGTVIVTLEPCSHQGLTPPCADALIEAGVARVVVGAIDPDSRVSGQGVARLRRSGVVVAEGLLSDEIEAIDPAYFHHRRSGRPRVTLKAAMTLDGQIAAADRSSQWITGEAARKHGHELRSQADAVMVGSGTVIDDDPRLDSRIPGSSRPQPRPIVMVGTRDLPADAQILQRQPLLVSGRPLEMALENSGETIAVASDTNGRPLLEPALRAIGELGYLDILVEGGVGLASALWKAGLVDRGVFYLAGRMAGGRGLGVFDGTWDTLENSTEIEIVAVERLGSDLRVEWVPVRNQNREVG